MMPTVWMTPTEAAVALGVTRQRVSQLIHAGKLSPMKRGRRWWVTADSVEAYRTNPIRRVAYGKLYYERQRAE